MYLSDKDIESLLPELKIETDNPEYSFSQFDQIQPCSIDLTLGNTFWIPKKHWTIDLRKKKLLDIQPRRYYRKVVLKKGEHLTLKPGKLLLAHIYEIFTIPSSCAGKISGRSSFARLGLMVHCTGDFINPGYRGHMSLQLSNLCANSIKIFPYLPICQLQLVKLSNIPSRLYNDMDLQSKYMDDDGGPSYWWKDKRIKKLHKMLGEADISLAIQESIFEAIGDQEPEVIERLERTIEKSKVKQIENCDSLLQHFAKSEDRHRIWRYALVYGVRGIFPMLLATSLGSFLSESHEYQVLK